MPESEITNRPPDMTGPFGSAWRITVAPECITPDSSAAVRTWMVNRPGAHPLWSWYLVSAVHLRPIDGATPPKFQRPDATHEISIISVHNSHALTDNLHVPVDIERCERENHGLTFLTPPDLCFQPHGITDDQAAEAVDHAAHLIVVDGWSPDSDFRRRWEDSLAIHFQHIREESRRAVVDPVSERLP